MGFLQGCRFGYGPWASRKMSATSWPQITRTLLGWSLNPALQAEIVVSQPRHESFGVAPGTRHEWQLAMEVSALMVNHVPYAASCPQPRPRSATETQPDQQPAPTRHRLATAPIHTRLLAFLLSARASVPQSSILFFLLFCPLARSHRTSPSPRTLRTAHTARTLTAPTYTHTHTHTIPQHPHSCQHALCCSSCSRRCRRLGGGRAQVRQLSQHDHRYRFY